MRSLNDKAQLDSEVREGVEVCKISTAEEVVRILLWKINGHMWLWSEIWGTIVTHTTLQSKRDPVAAPGSESRVDLLLHQVETIIFKHRSMFFIRKGEKIARWYIIDDGRKTKTP